MTARWGEIDGVTALWTDAGDVQGPLHASLIFATGRSDETLKVAGINHVVEHLALHALGHPAGYAWNGQVDPVTTQFWAVGGADQVAGFFGTVARQLARLQVDRLADELRVLEIEGRRRGASHLGVDLRERFGPHGAGLIGWPEYGLSRLDADEVVEWAHTHFTTGNAVMWLSGPPPPNLTLRELPIGPPIEHPSPPTLLATGRTVIAAETPRISLSVVSGSGPGINPIMQFAQQRALQRLRGDALSYAVEFNPLRVGGGRAVQLLEADGADDAPARVAVGLVEILGELAESGPTDDEVAGRHEYVRQFREHSDWILGALDAAARRRLLDGDLRTPEEAAAISEAQTSASMRDELDAVMSTMLMVGPESVGEHLSGWSVGARWSTASVQGDVYQPIGGREQGTLVVGADGVSWGPDGRRRITVRWDDVEACLTLDNGIRCVIGAAGSMIWIMPWNWRGGEDLTRLVDDAVDPLRRIHGGEGETTVPHPNTDGGRVDVHWLGTIAGAVWKGRQRDHLSLVIDTDGVFVLHGAHAGAHMHRHLEDARSADHDALLASDPRNRWIPQTQIAEVELRRRAWTVSGPRSWTLTIWLVDGVRHSIFLTSDDQVRVARTQFPRLLGARFRE